MYHGGASPCAVWAAGCGWRCRDASRRRSLRSRLHSAGPLDDVVEEVGEGRLRQLDDLAGGSGSIRAVTGRSVHPRPWSSLQGERWRPRSGTPSVGYALPASSQLATRWPSPSSVRRSARGPRVGPCERRPTVPPAASGSRRSSRYKTSSSPGSSADPCATPRPTWGANEVRFRASWWMLGARVWSSCSRQPWSTPPAPPCFASEMDEIAAVHQAPFVLVSDPAHPAAARAGASPLVVVAQGALGASVQVSHEDANRLSELPSLLRQGGIVLVVDHD